MEIVNFSILNFEDWRIVKQIRLEKTIGGRFLWADLVYTRSVSANYIKKTEQVETPLGVFFDLKHEYPEDDFDKLVMKAIRQDYPNATARNADITTDMDIKRLSSIWGNQSIEQAIIYLQPDFSGSEFGKYPVGTKSPVFQLSFDIYFPCKEFQMYFCNEGYFINYRIEDADTVKKELESIKPSVHRLEESIRGN